MGKTMTDQEFETLKNKIAVTVSYLEQLQTLHMGQTGRQYHPFERPQNRDRWEAMAQVKADFGRMV
jgi:hypothetical protein